ncbi:hypothetical protein BHU72_07535 [Desulfuribacillus stibiiarsenatis]|uniref:Uncharacterized protein n=1 Tax=Desulfuribacillus stibiiarsenatis TaxID=1390249 RepID=A0A1E5L3H8_9FIRM|nr:hypothetical protein [Desulfuribacillus stibiiarsenatis]OEH84682.1 hypothetical protein BHU72_07535 [Desulfuribacillus stibiiarsenatis]
MTLMGLELPSNIEFTQEDDKHIRMHIEKPMENMQNDSAAFEAWALCLKAKMNCNIILSYQEYNCWDKSFYKLCCKQTHYMRFLYRLWKFSELMSEWFKIDVKCIADVEQFKRMFLELKANRQYINNTPINESETSKSNEHRDEHFVEKAFITAVGKEKLNQLLAEEKESKLKIINNQLPNGLFKGKLVGDIKELNRIFPTGFIDLWGISEKDDLCIFELKIDSNNHVGIISQLFFYANYCKDVFYDKVYNDRIQSYKRGYKELHNTVKSGIVSIKAYFLAPGYHKEINVNRNRIEEILNQKKDITKIEYKFLDYDYESIKEIVDTSVKIKL